MRNRTPVLAGLALTFAASSALAAELNLYSSRHYPSDAALYAGFTEKTGIEIRLVEGKADELIERIIQEGAGSPADVLLTVDAGRLWRAEEAGVLAPFAAQAVLDAVPSNMRHPDNFWTAISQRARLIYKAPDAAPVATYEELGSSDLEGDLCIRSSSNIYNLSLIASLIEHHGEEAAAAWAEGVVANFARDPEGGDTDQIRAVAAGACDYAVGNHYYFARLMASEDPVDQEVVAAVEPILPNQDGRGAHVNVSGAAIVAAGPNKAEAEAFLEYLVSDEAQALLASGNFELPVTEGVTVDHPGAEMLAGMKADALDIAILGENQTQAQILADEAGWP